MKKLVLAFTLVAALLPVSAQAAPATEDPFVAPNATLYPCELLLGARCRVQYTQCIASWGTVETLVCWMGGWAWA